jgi:hypothetical protein
MISQTSSYEVETAAGSRELSSCATWSDTRLALSGICGRKLASRADLVFASEILGRLRDGLTPPQRMLECSGFVEHWLIVARDDVCLLKGMVWRLPFSRSMLTTPLLAIDPVAGWARAVDEWLTIGPRFDLVATGIHPDSVADRAARWLERQLRSDDCGQDGLAHN